MLRQVASLVGDLAKYRVGEGVQNDKICWQLRNFFELKHKNVLEVPVRLG